MFTSDKKTIILSHVYFTCDWQCLWQTQHSLLDLWLTGGRCLFCYYCRRWHHNSPRGGSGCPRSYYEYDQQNLLMSDSSPAEIIKSLLFQVNEHKSCYSLLYCHRCSVGRVWDFQFKGHGLSPTLQVTFFMAKTSLYLCFKWASSHLVVKNGLILIMASRKMVRIIIYKNIEILIHPS